jgi:hypothetical protein
MQGVIKKIHDQIPGKIIEFEVRQEKHNPSM